MDNIVLAVALIVAALYIVVGACLIARVVIRVRARHHRADRRSDHGGVLITTVGAYTAH